MGTNTANSKAVNETGFKVLTAECTPGSCLKCSYFTWKHLPGSLNKPRHGHGHCITCTGLIKWCATLSCVITLEKSVKNIEHVFQNVLSLN